MSSSSSVRHFFHDFHPHIHSLTVNPSKSLSPTASNSSAIDSSSVSFSSSTSADLIISTKSTKMVVPAPSHCHSPFHSHDDFPSHSHLQPKHLSTSSSSSSPLLGHLRRSFWNCKCFCLFSTLPDELMIFNLFSFFSHEELSLIAHVCTRWRWLVSDPTLWKYLDFSHRKLSDEGFISLVERFGSSIETLKLCNNMHLTEKSLSLLGTETPLLRELHLCHLNPISDSIVTAVANNCHHLQHLSLFGCTRVTDESIKVLGDRLSDTLNELSLRNCPQLTDDAMAVLPKNLRGLNIASNRRITGEGVSSLATRCQRLERLNVHSILVTDQAVELLSKQCKNLSTLHLSSSNPFGGNVRLTDHALESLSSLKRLRCLNLQGSSSLTDAGVARLVTSLPKLQRLNLGGCYRITDLSLAFLAKHNPQLTHLSLFQCFHVTDKGLMMIMIGLKNLLHLDVHSCVGLTSQTLALLSMEVDETDSDLEESQSDCDSTSSSNESSMAKKESGSRVIRSLLDSDDEDDDGVSELEADEQMNGTTSPRSSISIPSAASSSLSSSPSFSSSNYYLPRLRTLDVGACRQITLDDIRNLQTARQTLQIIFHQA